MPYSHSIVAAVQVLWALPLTLIGACLAMLVRLTGGHWHWHQGVLEAHSGCAPWLLSRLIIAARAITLGQVVIAANEAGMTECRSHERVHVKQALRWGVLFPFAYAWASLTAHLKGGHFYWDNRFEKEAYALECKP